MAAWPLPETTPQWHLDLGASNLTSFHREFLAPPLLAEAGRARRIHDHLAGCFYSTVFSPCTSAIVSSSLGPPAAGNESIHILWHAARVAHSAVWEYQCHAMHFVIPRHPGIRGMTLVHSRFPGMKKQARE